MKALYAGHTSLLLSVVACLLPLSSSAQLLAWAQTWSKGHAPTLAERARAQCQPSTQWTACQCTAQSLLFCTRPAPQWIAP